MAKTAVAAIILSVLLISSIPTSHCSKKKPAAAARREDIPFIKCQVCQKLASQLHRQVTSKEAQISPKNKKISEYEVIELAENLCNLKKEEGDWIFRIDIVEKGDVLELVEQESEGECNTECKTIEKACQEVMDYSDTDLAEFVFKKKPDIEQLVSFLCNDLTAACAVKPPPIPKDRIPGEAFVPKSSKEAEMEKMLRSMQGLPGAPGMKMYSKEDLLNNNFGDDDADDDDEDDDFPSNLGKVLREKQLYPDDWKQKVLKGIKESTVGIRKRVNKVSHWVKDWWKGKKAAATKPSKSGKTEL